MKLVQSEAFLTFNPRAFSLADGDDLASKMNFLGHFTCRNKFLWNSCSLIFEYFMHFPLSLLGRDGKRENRALPSMGFQWDGFSWEMKKGNRGKKGTKGKKRPWEGNGMGSLPFGSLVHILKVGGTLKNSKISFWLSKDGKSRYSMSNIEFSRAAFWIV